MSLKLIQILSENPILLLFCVAGIGCVLGKIPVLGVRIGSAGVLFAGLAISSLDSRLVLPDVVYLIGLVVFVYTAGLACGPMFLENFRKSGVRYNALVLTGLIFAFLVTYFLRLILGLSPNFASGMFVGSLTNTPALAAVLEHLHSQGAVASNLQRVLSEPVVAYSLTYPLGVGGMILVLAVAKRFVLPEVGHVLDETISDRTIEITQTPYPALKFWLFRLSSG